MNLADLYNYIGADIAASASGDIQTATTTLRGEQRVLRRLLTNPGDYIFHPEYGAGLPRYIGMPADVPKITALIRGQMALEDAVAKSPTPVVTVTPISNGDGGGVAVGIQYTDANTGKPVTLNFRVAK